LDDLAIYPYARSATQVKVDNLDTQVAVILGGRSDDNLTDGLVLWYKMDESATPSLDSSGNGNSGTWYNNTSAISGKFGNAVDLDGTDDYVKSGVIAGNSFTGTVSMWIYRDTSPSVSYLFDARGNPLTGSGYSYLNSSAFVVSSGNVYVDGVSATSVGTGAWHHVVITGITLYAPNYVAFGNSLYTNFEVDGKMDDVRVYNRALSPAEVDQLYNWAPGPVMQLEMEEGSGTTLYDTSGNSRNGTLNGNPTWSTGKYGKGVKLDGTGDFVQINDF